MLFVRSLLFLLVLIVSTPVYALIALPALLLPRDNRYRLMTTWGKMVQFCARHILGIRYRVIGLENLPPQPSVILSKHQSAWETIVYQQIFPPQSFVLKKELLFIPFFGWGLACMPVIALNRRRATNALQQLLVKGKTRLQQGYWVLIYPEGTRVLPGRSERFKAGGAWLAVKTGVSVVPVAHNAGEFWGKNAFIKRPGEITVSIGPVIDTAGREAAEVNQLAQQWVEDEMRRLFPHHYAGEAIEDRAVEDKPNIA